MTENKRGCRQLQTKFSFSHWGFPQQKLALAQICCSPTAAYNPSQLAPFLPLLFYLSQTVFAVTCCSVVWQHFPTDTLTLLNLLTPSPGQTRSVSHREKEGRKGEVEEWTRGWTRDGTFNKYILDNYIYLDVCLCVCTDMEKEHWSATFDLWHEKGQPRKAEALLAVAMVLA